MNPDYHYRILIAGSSWLIILIYGKSLKAMEKALPFVPANNVKILNTDTGMIEYDWRVI